MRLTLNGTELGAKTSTDHIFTWDIRLQPGKNTVIAESVSDGRTYTDAVTWHLS